MKGNIKKLSALVGVPVIALFIMFVMASAGPAIPHGINGVYQVTGYSSCDPTSQGTLEITYTFSNDGTGSFSGTGRNIDASGGSSGPLQCPHFTYTVDEQGRIEFLYPFPPGGIQSGHLDDQGKFQVDFTLDGGPSHGFISPDGKTITISCGHPVALHVINPGTGQPVSPDIWCITSLAGMRVK